MLPLPFVVQVWYSCSRCQHSLQQQQQQPDHQGSRATAAGGKRQQQHNLRLPQGQHRLVLLRQLLLRLRRAMLLLCGRTSSLRQI
jgi:hypothetical protein